MADVPESDDERRYRSMEDAFRDQGTSMANQVFLRRLFAAIDVEGYYGRSGYLKVTRQGGGPALEVHHGWTNGFRSKEEIVAAVGEDPEVWRSGRMRNTWGVTNPDHGSMHDAGDRKPRRTISTPCPECGDVLSVSGICNNPDCVMFGIVN